MDKASLNLSTGFLKLYFAGDEMRNVTPVLEVVSTYKKGDRFWMLSDGQEGTDATECLLAENLKQMAMALPAKARVIVFEYSLTKWGMGRKNANKFVIRNAEPFTGVSLPCSAIAYMLELNFDSIKNRIDNETQTEPVPYPVFPSLLPKLECWNVGHSGLCQQSRFMVRRLIEYITLFYANKADSGFTPGKGHPPVHATVSKMFGLSQSQTWRIVNLTKESYSNEMSLPRCENIRTTREMHKEVRLKAYEVWLRSKGKGKFLESEEPTRNRFEELEDLIDDEEVGEEEEYDGEGNADTGDDGKNAVNVLTMPESSNQQKEEVDATRISLLEYDNMQLKMYLKRRIKTIADKDKEISMLKQKLKTYEEEHTVDVPETTNANGNESLTGDEMEQQPVKKRPRILKT